MENTHSDLVQETTRKLYQKVQRGGVTQKWAPWVFSLRVRGKYMPYSCLARRFFITSDPLRSAPL